MRAMQTLQPHVIKYVLPASSIFTDEWPAYAGLEFTYRHHRIRHSEEVYVSGNVHTQTIEGFFSNLKRGIAGTYHSVSTQHLQSYLDEYAFRYNHRDEPGGMFEAFLGRIERVTD